MASPYHDLIEGQVGKVLKKHFSRTLTKRIFILEIGFGTGITSKVILNSDKRIFLESIDNEPEMLEIAEKTWQPA